MGKLNLSVDGVRQAEICAETNPIITLKVETYESSIAASSETSELVLASIKADPKELVANQERAPISVVAVIDRSGSMAGEKLTLVKKTLRFLVDQMGSQDQLGIVVYDDSAETVLQLMLMDGQGQRTALSAIERIQTRGCTNICDGLCYAAKLFADKSKVTNDIKSILLFTDGLVNVGPTTSIEMLRRMKDAYEGNNNNNNTNNTTTILKKKKKSPRKKLISKTRKSSKSKKHTNKIQPIMQQQQQQTSMLTNMMNFVTQTAFMPPIETPQEDTEVELTGARKQLIRDIGRGLPVINTFGYGANHDKDLLTELAENGGMYYFLENEDAIEEGFADCFGGLMSIVAQDITLTLNMCNGHQVEACLSHCTNQETVKDQSWEVSFADLQQEEARDSLFRIHLPAVNVDDENTRIVAGELVLTYYDVSAKVRKESHAPVYIDRSQQASDDTQTTLNLNVGNHLNRYKTVEALEKAAKLAKDHTDASLKEARAVINAVIAAIEESPAGKTNFSQSLIKDLKTCLDGMQNRRVYESHGSKYIATNVVSQGHQRHCGNMVWAAQNEYCTSSKKRMKSKMKLFS